MEKLRVCVIAVIAVMASSSLKANSQCLVMTVAKAKEVAQFVLLGRVVVVERERLRSVLTVDVERFWKGTALKRVTLYQSHEVFGGDPAGLRTRFEVGETYVIFAGLEGRTMHSDYVDDCMSKPARSFDLAELGDGKIATQ